MSLLSNIPLPLEYTLKKKVLKKDSAKQFGSGLVEVFATPALIAFMEKTCHLSVASFLPAGMSSVGIEIHIHHLKATAIGKIVVCTSQLIEIDGKRLLFSVKAHDDSGLIGDGTHTRFLIDVAKFMKRLE